MREQEALATKGCGRFGFSQFVVLSLLAAIVCGGVAQAGEEARERAARKACLSGNVKKGVEILSDLFVKTTDPVFIYNQGRCFEQNDLCKEAIPRFREYLRKAKNARAEDRSEAERHIADCQALIGHESPSVETGAVPLVARPHVEKEATTPSAIGKPTGNPPPLAVETTAPPGSMPQTTAVPPAPVEKPAEQGGGGVVAADPDVSAGRSLRIAGLACGGLGLASIAGGVYFYTRARSYSDRVSTQDPPDPSDTSAGKNAETMQWVFYSAGGVALGTGIVLYLLGSSRTQAEPHVATVGPVFGPGLAGVVAQGAF